MSTTADQGGHVRGAAPSAVRVSELSCRFGELTALADVSIDVAPSAITALIGPNGAGKTTLLNVISGLVTAAQGRVFLGEYDITEWSVQARARGGMARTFQTPRLLERESVLTNVLVGCEPMRRPDFFRELVNFRSARRARARDIAAGRRTIEELGLSKVATRPVRELPFALRRVVEIGRALVSSPGVLLLDEPAAGLEPGERSVLAEILTKLVKGRNVTILLIEHDVAFVARVAQAALALDFGRVVAAGTVNDVLNSAAVRTSFFGELADDDRA